MNRDMEEKEIVVRELRCRTAAELRTPQLPSGHRRASAAVQQLRRCTLGAELPPKLSGCSSRCPPGAEKSGGGSWAAVRQLSPGSTIPFFCMSPPPDCRGSSPAAPAVPPAEKGIVLPELSCRRVSSAGAARPLVHKVLVGKWEWMDQTQHGHGSSGIHR
ncbi:unnamed protein product [Boreogadus saida]